MNNALLNHLAIKEFKEIYQSRYGIKLSNKEAFEKATKLYNLYKTVFVDKFGLKTQLNSPNIPEDQQ